MTAIKATLPVLFFKAIRISLNTFVSADSNCVVHVFIFSIRQSLIHTPTGPSESFLHRRKELNVVNLSFHINAKKWRTVGQSELLCMKFTH